MKVSKKWFSIRHQQVAGRFFHLTSAVQFQLKKGSTAHLRDHFPLERHFFFIPTFFVEKSVPFIMEPCQFGSCWLLIERVLPEKKRNLLGPFSHSEWSLQRLLFFVTAKHIQFMALFVIDKSSQRTYLEIGDPSNLTSCCLHYKNACQNMNTIYLFLISFNKQ